MANEDDTKRPQRSQPGPVTTQTPQPPSGREPEVHSPQGGYLVKAPWGHAFRSSNDEFPVVDATGVRVSKEQADTLVAEAKALRLRLTAVPYESTDDD